MSGSFSSFFSNIFSGVANKSVKLTVPFDSPDSNSDIGRMVSHANLPVPVCSLSFSASLSGTAEPVNMNWPILCRWSTADLTESHTFGTVCHSSISIGGLPPNAASVSISRSRLKFSFMSVFANKTLLAAISSAVVVFPHHLGPSITTAPLAASFFANRPSIIRCLYHSMTV